MPLDGPQLAKQGAVFNKNFFADFKVRDQLEGCLLYTSDAADE